MFRFFKMDKLGGLGYFVVEPHGGTQMPTPRKPNEEHAKAGTFRSDRHGTRDTAKAVDLVRELPAPPDYLRQYAQDHWAELGTQMVKEEKLTYAELHQLALVCQTYGMLRDLDDVLTRRREMFEGEPLMLDDDETMKAIKESRAQADLYFKFLTAMGMGALARSQATQGIPKSKSGGVMTRSMVLK